MFYVGIETFFARLLNVFESPALNKSGSQALNAKCLEDFS